MIDMKLLLAIFCVGWIVGVDACYTADDTQATNSNGNTGNGNSGNGNSGNGAGGKKGDGDSTPQPPANQYCNSQKSLQAIQSAVATNPSGDPNQIIRQVVANLATQFPNIKSSQWEVVCGQGDVAGSVSPSSSKKDCKITQSTPSGTITCRTWQDS